MSVTRPGEPWVGVVSDTHGLLRPQLLDALEGAEVIIHAGDLGAPEVLQALRRLAPVHVVRGNVDRGPWAEALPPVETVSWRGFWIYVLHDLEQLDLDPSAAGFHAVVHGHTHVPEAAIRKGVLYLNPGSAGPRRFRLPVTCARLALDGDRLLAETVSLLPPAA